MSSAPLYRYPVKLASWNERDVLIFAASIGCDANNLSHVYELHPDFSPFPTYPITLTFKHDYTSTASFAEHFRNHLTPPNNVIPNFPGLDIQTVVDGDRTLEILRTLPTSSKGRTFVISSKVTQIWDKGVGKSTIVRTEHDLVERRKRQEILYTRMSETAIFMSQGGWNGPNEKLAPSKGATSPDRSPDVRVPHQIPATAHLLYRLNGDYNPLHATQVAEAVVQPTPIMHGLYSWNVAARIVLSTFANGGSLKSFRASFASPVRPGDILEVEMWEEVSREKKGERLVKFVAKVSGTVVLANGTAVLVEGQIDRESKL